MQTCHECAAPADPECSFEDPTGKGPPLPMCREHFKWAEGLVQILKGAPELKQARTRFERL